MQNQLTEQVMQIARTRRTRPAKGAGMFNRGTMVENDRSTAQTKSGLQQYLNKKPPSFNLFSIIALPAVC
jgi:hypothetical protein